MKPLIPFFMCIIAVCTVALSDSAESHFKAGEFKLNHSWFGGIDAGTDLDHSANGALKPTKADSATLAATEQHTIPAPGALVLNVMAIASIGWLHRKKMTP